MRFANGDEYMGRWERDEFNGKGSYSFNQRNTLTGEFRNGKFYSYQKLQE